MIDHRIKRLAGMGLNFNQGVPVIFKDSMPDLGFQATRVTPVAFC